MATRTELSLPETRIETVELEGDCIRVRLAPCFLYVALSGSAQETKWRQAASLVFERGEITAGGMSGGVLAGGDLQDNTYTYRDRVPLPLDSRGQVGCLLRFQDGGEPLEIHAERVRLEPSGERRYVQHVG